MTRDYFETDNEIAEYLGMALADFLKLKVEGRFPLVPQPKDPAMIYRRSDVDEWILEGKPAYRKRL